MALLAAWFPAPAYSQDATWAGPGNNWNTGGNWSPAAVPTNVATFAGATPTSINVSLATTINTIAFTPGAPAYSFTILSPNNLIIQGAGIINNSANAPSFTTNPGASLFFFNGSTAANSVFTNNGTMGFFNTSSAGTATITSSGLINFLDTSSADQASITINSGGTLGFRNNSTAADATIVNNGAIDFLDSSTAGNATVTTNSGAVTFFQTNASGGQARFITNAGGTFDISGLTNGGTTAGSIEGAGNYVLGVETLTVGGNNLSTEVSGVISGSGGSLVKVGSGTLTLSGANTYGGATIIDSGTLAAGATNTLSPNSAVTVASGGTLELNGFNQTIPGLTNSGLVNMGIGTPPGTLLTTTNYIGNGGTIAMNTFLGADNSASDKLVINGGTASGTTSLIIHNVGGPGAQTTSNGILVVNAIGGATTAPGAFTLDNPELRAGEFDYRLFQGGLNGTDPNDWFLRSTFIAPPALVPIIGPELATYGVVQPIARQMGLTTLGTLHERIGDTLADPCQGATALPNTSTPMFRKAPVAPTGCAPNWGGPSVWGRVFGQQVDNHYEAFADPRADGHVIGFQSGVDLWRGSLLPGHRDGAGFYAAYTNGNVNVTGLVTNPAATAFVLTHTGSLNLDGWSGGAYWTHYGPTGWYLDAVLQGTAYQGRASTAFASLSTNGWGFISSLESGYPIPVRWLGPSFVLEPQAQILWQQVSFNDGNDGLGNVALGTTSGTTGRIGLRGQWTVLGAAGQVWQPYVLANLWRDWGAQANTTFDTDVVPLQEQATRLDLGAGVTARITRNLSLYAQGGYQFAVGGTDGGKRDGVKGDGGIRYTW